MKKALIYTFLVMALAFASANSVMAQTPPHPGEQSGAGAISGGRIGAGAPVGNGTFILLALALAYAGRKIYIMRRPVEE